MIEPVPPLSLSQSDYSSLPSTRLHSKKRASISILEWLFLLFTDFYTVSPFIIYLCICVGASFQNELYVLVLSFCGIYNQRASIIFDFCIHIFNNYVDELKTQNNKLQLCRILGTAYIFNLSREYIQEPKQYKQYEHIRYTDKLTIMRDDGLTIIVRDMNSH